MTPLVARRVATSSDLCKPPPDGRFGGKEVGYDSPKRQEEPMPVHRSKDSQGPYYQWGDSGKKYHYTAGDRTSREKAKEKAEKQGRAARASGYKG